jgi:hypothetical protein
MTALECHHHVQAPGPSKCLNRKYCLTRPSTAYANSPAMATYSHRATLTVSESIGTVDVTGMEYRTRGTGVSKAGHKLYLYTASRSRGAVTIAAGSTGRGEGTTVLRELLLHGSDVALPRYALRKPTPASNRRRWHHSAWRVEAAASTMIPEGFAACHSNLQSTHLVERLARRRESGTIPIARPSSS